MYKEKFGEREYFAEIVKEERNSFLKIWWDKDGEEVALLLCSGNGLEYLVKDFVESDSINAVYKQLTLSLYDELVGNVSAFGAWKGGRIRFTYWVNEKGIFFADENSDEVHKFTIEEIFNRLIFDLPEKHPVETGGSQEDKLNAAIVSRDKYPCPFQTGKDVCFADGEKCDYFRKFVVFGYTCPRYISDFKLFDALMGKFKNPNF
jgi:hypothetical protein